MVGHQDDAEPAMDKPIVSIAIGWPAVFLIGGRDRSITPAAILVRSGDVIILSGESRYSYHGVPLILPLSEAGTDVNELTDSLLTTSGTGESVDDECVKVYLKTGRLNMNIRQVVHDKNDLISRN